jgi:hypothetical protein
MYVRMYVCMNVCMLACNYVCVHVCKLFMYLRICTYTYVCMYVLLQFHISVPFSRLKILDVIIKIYWINTLQ